MSTPSTRKFRATVFTAVLAVVSLAPASQAQDQKIGGMVNVPFAFETAYQHFEPASYAIRLQSPNIMLIEGTSGSGFVMTQLAGDLQPANKSKVVFRRAGDRHFLDEISIAEKSGHMDVNKSKAERPLQVPGSKTEGGE